MKYFFVETRYEGKIKLPKSFIDKLPKNIVLSMPVQFLNFLESIKEQLENNEIKVELFRGNHDKYAGQILGCDILRYPGDFDAFVYIGDGLFHPTALLYENNKEVYCYNPFNDKIDVLKYNLLEKVHKRRKGLLAKFLTKNNIGLLVTTKPGQNQSKSVQQVSDKLEKAGKNVFVFVDHNIHFDRLINFNFIDVWINTGCPRIVQDFSCLNMEDLNEIGDYSVVSSVFPRNK